MSGKLAEVLKWKGGELDFSGGTLIMGILNVTPDSFSDGGEFFDTEAAVSHAVQMQKEGAAIIDIGAESTRPGSVGVNADEQIRRAVPVIEQSANKVTVPISIDTFNYEVAKAAIAAGAGMINDITALADERMCELAAKSEVAVVLMHMKGKPATMQDEPKYADVVGEVLDFLLERAQDAQRAGVNRKKIFIDPGIGFGKKLEHNIELLANIDKFVASGYRVLVGASRKKFIGELTGRDVASDRSFGTAATVAHCVAKGVSIVRVHDVKEMGDVVKVTRAIL
ncbi:MAG: dihydropteroate synthase [Phycisphaerae bacterium]|nr:dihydropteroate synthase [Phycisphaerae bacterium]